MGHGWARESGGGSHGGQPVACSWLLFVAGSSSPARPGTPLAACSTPPPPPPRPPSRPKLPPGKPGVADVVCSRLRAGAWRARVVRVLGGWPVCICRPVRQITERSKSLRASDWRALPGLFGVFCNLFSKTNYTWGIWLWTPPCSACWHSLAMPAAGEQWFAVMVKAKNGCKKGPGPWGGSGSAWPPRGNAVRVWPSWEGCLAGDGCPAIFGGAPRCHTTPAGLPGFASLLRTTSGKL